MKLEELVKSTNEVRKFSDGDILLTLWFEGPKCRSMEVVFDMLSSESVLFCSKKKLHYYDTQKEVRYGYELTAVAAHFKSLPLEKIAALKSSISHLSEGLRRVVLNFLKPIEGRGEVL